MKTVLITGASRGIGLELALQYFSEGWKVIACSRRPKDIPGFISLKLDVTNEKDIQNLAKYLQNESIDLLINNAGISGPSNEEANREDWLETFKVNTIAPVQIAHALLPQLEKGELKIIANISSVYGSIELNNRNDYYIHRSSKAALNAVTKCLANELREKEIIAVAIHPGSVKTDMNPSGKFSPQESATGIRKVLSSLSLNDTGSFRDYQNRPLPW